MHELIDKARKYIPLDNIPMIEEALDFASNAHLGQKRLSGEPFIEHPIKTAMFLADLNLDATTLTAAILHDVIEDCDVDIVEIQNRFGPDVSALVDGVTKLSKIETLNNEYVRSTNYDSGQSENIRKMLVAMAKDIRVVLIKLADRLHNMQTLHAHEEQKRRRIAQETLEIYAPLAHRLGMWDIKWQLEDLSFEHVAPIDYKNMSDLVASKREERERFITEKCNIISKKLNEAGISRSFWSTKTPL